MSNHRKIAIQCQTGDILLIGMSRRQAEVFTSAAIVLGTMALYSVRTHNGHQAVQENLYDFLESHNKPIRVARFKEELILDRLPPLIKRVRAKLSVKPNWWQKMFHRKRERFKKDNHINVTRLITDHLDIDDLVYINKDHEFNILL